MALGNTGYDATGTEMEVPPKNVIIPERRICIITWPDHAGKNEIQILRL